MKNVFLLAGVASVFLIASLVMWLVHVRFQYPFCATIEGLKNQVSLWKSEVCSRDEPVLENIAISDRYVTLTGSAPKFNPNQLSINKTSYFF